MKIGSETTGTLVESFGGESNFITLEGTFGTMGLGDFLESLASEEVPLLRAERDFELVSVVIMFFNLRSSSLKSDRLLISFNEMRKWD